MDPPANDPLIDTPKIASSDEASSLNWRPYVQSRFAPTGPLNQGVFLLLS